MITIVDYGLGNVLAFANVYKRLNVAVKAATDRDSLAGASKVILPGVGAFDHAMERLTQSGMRATLEELVLGRGVPVLGVCVGMQMLAASSEEGKLPGLGWIAGEVRKFRWSDAVASPLRLPHMGWNDAAAACPSPLFARLEQGARFYFLHSYYFACQDPQDALALTEYGSAFASAVHRQNIYGVQFHPEKSHHFGTQLLLNFASL